MTTKPVDIIFHLIQGDSRVLPGLEIEDVHRSLDEEWLSYESDSLGWEALLGEIIESTGFKPTKPGAYIALGFCAIYHRGDGWMTDDDVEFHVDEFRLALADEELQMARIEQKRISEMDAFPTFPVAIASIEEDFLHLAKEVKTETWQGVPHNTDTREIFDVNFQVDLQGIEDLNCWREEIKPNLPWADDHFLERIGGEPLNPGVQWAKWPWSRAADRHRKAERFNHTYMERLWPRYARRTEDGRLPTLPPEGALRRYPASDMRPKQGIGWNYGDLQDLVELLVAQPHTRQAWIPLFFPEDTGIGDGGRKPCTLGYQIIVRDGKAHIWYPLRSCDFIRHFRDDCYLAVRLLLWVIDECRKRSDAWKSIVPGTYSMHATSLHIFATDKIGE